MSRTVRSMGRIAGAAIAGVVMLAAVATAPALASGPTFGPFGMTPSPAASGQPRSYFNLRVIPGQTVTDSVVLTNLSSAPERLELRVSRGVTATNSGSAYENLTGRCTGPTCWISGLPHIVVLGPKEQSYVGFMVRVPRGIRPGQYLAGITLLAAKRPSSIRVGKRGPASARAIIIEEVTVGVAVTIGDLSGLTTGLRVGQPSTEWLGPVPRLNIPVRNTGQTFVRATGRVRCLSGGRSHSYRIIMSTVLPGQGAVLPVNARGLRTGSLPCAARLRTASGHLVSWSGAVTLASTVATRTYHPVKGVYVSLPEPSTPMWAIVLMMLGGLILAVLVLLLVRRRRLGASHVAPRQAHSLLGKWFGARTSN